MGATAVCRLTLRDVVVGDEFRWSGCSPYLARKRTLDAHEKHVRSAREATSLCRILCAHEFARECRTPLSNARTRRDPHVRDVTHLIREAIQTSQEAP